MILNEIPVLSFHPVALERTFVVADILAERYDEPFVEYGILGLGQQSNPFHVLETPILPGQRASVNFVFQPGRQVLHTRREIELLSKRRKHPLVPIALVHRHPGACGMSSIDVDFFVNVFVNHIATAVLLREPYVPGGEDFGCGCGTSRTRKQQTGGSAPEVTIDYAVAFSLIVNRSREYSIDAVRKSWCPFCAKPQVRLLPAELRVQPVRTLSESERRRIRSTLDVEIEAKIEFDKAPAEGVL